MHRLVTYVIDQLFLYLLFVLSCYSIFNSMLIASASAECFSAIISLVTFVLACFKSCTYFVDFLSRFFFKFYSYFFCNQSSSFVVVSSSTGQTLTLVKSDTLTSVCSVWSTSSLAVGGWCSDGSTRIPFCLSN
jgi:hypothetical protein